jgi:flagellar FliJ protein
MSKPFPLKPLLDLSRSHLDDVTRELGQLIAREQEGARKLDLLQGYRREYEARFRDAARNGIGVEAWRNYSAFMARIDEAIAAQRNHLEQSRRQTVAGQERWTHQRNRVKAFDTLETRHHARERGRLAKTEQRLSDEFAANRRRERDTDVAEP